ncbi:MAG: M20/M25/M40 family metallo-hydrolase [Lentisphaeria bacterium]|nr:M20/M25/M40 family metallo-hydrolase [Lentisphaeria bacterium]
MKPEFVELLKQLIASAPVSADTPAVNRASAIMEDFLKAHGIRVVREVIDGKNTLYASVLPEGKETEVLFNAHLDVVPLNTPYQNQPYIQDGRLYGRGAGDDLGDAVVVAQVLCDNPDKSVAAIFTTDEEIGGHTTDEMLKLGYRCTRGAVVLDIPGENTISCQEKGMIVVRVTAHGRGGHSALPWTAVNAIDMLMEGYQKLRKAWANPTSEDDWVDSLSATGITCSSKAHNVIPDTASILFNIRYTKPGTEEAILNKIKTLTGCDDLEVQLNFVPLFCNEDCEFVQNYLRCAKKITGQDYKLKKMHGATDARYIAWRYPDIPVIQAGVRNGNIHDAGEWCDLEDAGNLIRICSEMLK